MLKFFKNIGLAEWLIWSVSVVASAVCFFVFHNRQYHYLIGSVIGFTALVFSAKGHPIGQLLCIVFSIFYGIISYSFRYYGEMITYLGMSAPIAVWALISWLKNPFHGNKSEVEIKSLSKKEWGIFAALCAVVTLAFYFILRALNTQNLIVSTISVLTSFAAVYLTARRSKFYAVGYALNDVVLIVLWSFAATENLTYLPMVVCFSAFLALDIYGFISWSRIQKRQSCEVSESEQKGS